MLIIHTKTMPWLFQAAESFSTASDITELCSSITHFWFTYAKYKWRERKQTARCSHRLLPISADPLNLSLTCTQLNIKAGDCIIFISSHSVTCLIWPNKNDKSTIMWLLLRICCTLRVSLPPKITLVCSSPHLAILTWSVC